MQFKNKIDGKFSFSRKKKFTFEFRRIGVHGRHQEKQQCTVEIHDSRRIIWVAIKWMANQ